MIFISDISTAMSLKLKKKSILKLVGYVFLVNFCTLILEFVSPPIISIWTVACDCKRFLQTNLTLSHTQETTVQSSLHHRKVIG